MEWYTCGGFCRTCCLQYSLKSSDPPDWVLPIPLSKNLWITMVMSEPDRMEYSLLGYDLRGIIEWSKIRPSWELVYCLWRSVYPALSWLETFWGLFQPEWWYSDPRVIKEENPLRSSILFLLFQGSDSCLLCAGLGSAGHAVLLM